MSRSVRVLDTSGPQSSHFLTVCWACRQYNGPVGCQTSGRRPSPGQWCRTKGTADEAMTRVLLIDDDVELCELIAQYMETEGFGLEAVYDGQCGVEQALSGQHTLVILDVMLPGMPGFDVLRRIRAHSRVPVLMLTARGEAIDRILGLELGADDYLPKPFDPRELAARIRAILRRTPPAESDLGRLACAASRVGHGGAGGAVWARGPPSHDS